MKNLFIRNLAKLLRERDISQSDLARRSGIRQSSISDYLTGKYDPKQDKIDAIAAALGVSPTWLMGGVDGQTSIRVPVLGRIPAGIPIEAIEEILSYEELSPDNYKTDKQYFALMVQGDSMSPRYLEGDVVIVERRDDCDSGKDCIVMVNDHDATLKRLIKYQNGSIELRPLNEAYNRITYTSEQVQNLPIRICGVVAELRRKI